MSNITSWEPPTLETLPRDAAHTALNVGLGGGYAFRMAAHVILTALILGDEESLTERVTAEHYGATLRLGVEAGLDDVERYIVRFGTAALLTLMALHLLRASIVTHRLGALFLAAQLAVPATDPLQEVIQDVI